MRNGEKFGIDAPSPKRRKFSHSGNNHQGRVGRFSGREPEDNADHLSAPKIASTVLVRGEPNSSTSRAMDSDLAATHAGDMSGSGLFKLQVDEMLLAVQPNYAKVMGPVDRALRRLKILIESIEDRELLTVSYFTIAVIVLRANTVA